MPKERAEYFLEVARQDLGAGLSYFEEEDFSSLNVIGNRVATTLAFGKIEPLVMMGFMVKEVAGEFSRLGRIGELEKNMQLGRKFLTDLKSLVDEYPVKTEQIWESYTEYEEEIRKPLLPEPERQAYSDNPDYTRECRKFLVEYLYKKKKLLLREESNLADGVSSELSRLINANGFHPEDLAFYLSLKALSHSSNLLRKDYLLAENEEKQKKRKEIISYVDRIHDLNDSNKEISSLRESFSNIIGSIGVKWRLFFINYGEISPIRRPERGVELPEETKKKISKILVKGLEKEIR